MSSPCRFAARGGPDVEVSAAGAWPVCGPRRGPIRALEGANTETMWARIRLKSQCFFALGVEPKSTRALRAQRRRQKATRLAVATLGRYSLRHSRLWSPVSQ